MRAPDVVTASRYTSMVGEPPHHTVSSHVPRLPWQGDEDQPLYARSRGRKNREGRAGRRACQGARLPSAPESAANTRRWRERERADHVAQYIWCLCCTTVQWRWRVVQCSAGQGRAGQGSAALWSVPVGRTPRFPPRTALTSVPASQSHPRRGAPLHWAGAPRPVPPPRALPVVPVVATFGAAIVRLPQAAGGPQWALEACAADTGRGSCPFPRGPGRLPTEL